MCGSAPRGCRRKDLALVCRVRWAGGGARYAYGEGRCMRGVTVSAWRVQSAVQTIYSARGGRHIHRKNTVVHGVTRCGTHDTARTHTAPPSVRERERGRAQVAGARAARDPGRPGRPAAATRPVRPRGGLATSHIVDSFNGEHTHTRTGRDEVARAITRAKSRAHTRLKCGERRRHTAAGDFELGAATRPTPG